MSATFVFLLLLGAAVSGVEPACTQAELQNLGACFENVYVDDSTNALGTTGTCNRSAITSSLCSVFTNIVNCINSAAVSDTECRPESISQINKRLTIPCMIEDFQAVCTDAPKINTGGSASLRGGWTIAVAVLVSAIMSSASLL